MLSAWERTIDPGEPLGDLTIELAREFGVGTDPKRKEIVLVVDDETGVGNAVRVKRAKLSREEL